MLGAEPLTGLLPLSMDLAAGSLKRSPIRKQKPSEKKQGKTSIPIPNYGLLKLAEVGCKLQNIERFATIKSGLGLITYIQKRL